jgi:hypothetical protein
VRWVVQKGLGLVGLLGLKLVDGMVDLLVLPLIVVKEY